MQKRLDFLLALLLFCYFMALNGNVLASDPIKKTLIRSPSCRPSQTPKKVLNKYASLKVVGDLEPHEIDQFAKFDGTKVTTKKNKEKTVRDNGGEEDKEEKKEEMEKDENEDVRKREKSTEKIGEEKDKGETVRENGLRENKSFKEKEKKEDVKIRSETMERRKSKKKREENREETEKVRGKTVIENGEKKNQKEKNSDEENAEVLENDEKWKTKREKEEEKDEMEEFIEKTFRDFEQYEKTVRGKEKVGESSSRTEEENVEELFMENILNFKKYQEENHEKTIKAFKEDELEKANKRTLKEEYEEKARKTALKEYLELERQAEKLPKYLKEMEGFCEKVVLPQLELKNPISIIKFIGKIFLIYLWFLGETLDAKQCKSIDTDVQLMAMQNGSIVGGQKAMIFSEMMPFVQKKSELLNSLDYEQMKKEMKCGCSLFIKQND